MVSIVRSSAWMMKAYLAVTMAFAPMAMVPPVYAERRAPEITHEWPVLNVETQIDEPDLVRVESLQPALTAEAYAMGVNSPETGAEAPGMVLKGSVQEEREFVPDVVFEDMHTLGKGEVLVLTIMDTLATGYSQHGDVFHARLKEEIRRDGKLLIPKGALIKGHIEEADTPGRSMSKRGHIALALDYVLMPDGRKVPLNSVYNKGDSGLQAVGRAVGNGLVGTVGGAVKGVLLGLKFGGLGAAALTHGATLMAGGGVGAVAGLGRGLTRDGAHVVLNEGDQIRVALQHPMDLPAFERPSDSEAEVQAPGLQVQVQDVALGRDPFKVENQVIVKLAIENQTSYTFGSLDVALMDEYNHVYALSPFGDGDMFVFQLKPQESFSGKATFSVMSPDLRHYLIFYRPYTREILAKVSLTEAMRHLSQAKTMTDSKSKSVFSHLKRQRNPQES